ncbi:MAG TPA: hypothetical protein VKU39_13755 [Streptosporangiaceae bacterium]|nr:hypothetical protein [Streptosporangiaceae bacterium]
MAGWYATRLVNRSAKIAIALMVLALVLVAAVPLAFFVGVIMMLFGHVVGGLALFGGSILAACAAVALAAMNGVRQVRHLREMVNPRRFSVVTLREDDYSHLG